MSPGMTSRTRLLVQSAAPEIPDPMPDTRLAFRDVTRGFGRLGVLSGVSGEAGSGEALLVTGANGSGKSTLLRCLAGLLALQKGEIELVQDGRCLDTRQRRLAVGYVAPDLAFYEELSTLENLRFAARLRRVPRERCGELLDLVGLPPDRLAGALSSGMMQRLRWCWALLHRPRLLLLDEPQQNLDAPGVELVQRLLAGHLDAGGLAVVANPSRLEIPRVARRIDLGR